MDIILFTIFLLTNLFVVGIVAFVYSGKEKYSEGMILGIHIPADQTGHEEVKKVAKGYKDSFKKFNLINLLTGTLVCLLCFVNLSASIFIWVVWLSTYIAVVMRLIYSFHRKMYDVKMKNNWMKEGNTHVIHIDTMVSKVSDRLPITHIWNLPAVAGTCLLVTLVLINKSSGADLIRWIIPAAGLPITFLFWGLHLMIARKKNVVLSTDSTINLAINRLEKRTWSVALLIANYLNLLGVSLLAWESIRNHWLYSMDYVIYIILQLLPAFVIIAGVIHIQKKRKEILSLNTAPLVVDDDEYWKNGWYSNPEDKHLFVPDRMCSTNYSMNMAHPAAKKIIAGTIAFVSIIFVAAFGLVIVLDNAKITFQIKDNQVTVEAAMYKTHFRMDEIKSVKILDNLPEDDYTRTNGGATDKYLIGHFSGRKTGRCMLFIYQNYSPVLEVKLADQTVYINSKDLQDVSEWYKALSAISP